MTDYIFEHRHSNATLTIPADDYESAENQAYNMVDDMSEWRCDNNAEVNENSLNA